jgi:glycosyltransferase involved in cell wall biosynthesis
MIKSKFKPGINIIGFPQGSLGIGEDARMVAGVFERQSVPVALINAPISGPPKLDSSMNHLLSDVLLYNTTIFCLPPTEMYRLAIEGGRHLIEAETYKIGAWPFELPHWPTSYHRLYEFVDEIWAQSKFVESVYLRLPNTRVRKMPMAVTIPKVEGRDRSHFGLPKDKFIFYLMFDGNSWLSRKNPLAGVMAYQQAFKRNGNAALVIKVMNVQPKNKEWAEILRISSEDPNIYILDELLDSQEKINFMACCDAYISLHRSEGFGRVIAEAMLLNQPVITTNFSGNLDFCHPNTSYLVDGKLIPLSPGDYKFNEGQYWFEPNIMMAAQQLIQVYENKIQRTSIASAGKAFILDNYSVEAVGRSYMGQLSESGLLIDSDES